MTKLALSIDVPNVEAARQFFSNGLGLKKLRDEPSNAVVMDAGGLELWLLPRAEGSLAVRETDISRTYKRHLDAYPLGYTSEQSARGLRSRSLGWSDSRGRHHS